MKRATFLAFLFGTSPVLSAADMIPTKRQSLEVTTDQYLFSLALPQFTAKRNARDPATLDWTTDDCTLSPDNPLGFPFAPACHRHDFGYQNYGSQSRFTAAARLRIDDKFKADLYYQCNTVSFILRRLCEALADVYYIGVRIFGGSDATKRDGDLLREFEEKVAIYNALVQVAQRYGDVPAGTGSI